MATATFTWTVNAQATPTIEYSIRTVKFGDGYEMTAGEGINNRKDQWSITWTGSDTDALAIMNFFDAQAGWKSFFWTNPLGQLGLYKCADPAPQEIGGNTFTITATFKKAYAA